MYIHRICANVPLSIWPAWSNEKPISAKKIFPLSGFPLPKHKICLSLKFESLNQAETQSDMNPQPHSHPGSTGYTPFIFSPHRCCPWPSVRISADTSAWSSPTATAAPPAAPSCGASQAVSSLQGRLPSLVPAWSLFETGWKLTMRIHRGYNWYNPCYTRKTAVRLTINCGSLRVGPSRDGQRSPKREQRRRIVELQTWSLKIWLSDVWFNLIL